MSLECPDKCTGITRSILFFLSFFSSSKVDIQNVFLSISTKSTLAPIYSAPLADATKVIADVNILDFEVIPKAKHERCKAAVPEAQAMAYFDPTYCANLSSNFLISGPCVINSDFKTFKISFLSFESIC